MPDTFIEELYKKALFNAQAFSQKQLNYSCADDSSAIVSCQRSRTVVMFMFDALMPNFCDVYCFSRLNGERNARPAEIDLCTLRDKTTHPEWQGVYEGNYYLCRSVDIALLAKSVASVEQIVDICIADCKAALERAATPCGA